MISTLLIIIYQISICINNLWKHQYSKIDIKVFGQKCYNTWFCPYCPALVEVTGAVDYLVSQASRYLVNLFREAPFPCLPWGPGGCQKAGVAWCWACLWAVWWHPSLSDKPPWAWHVPHDRGLTRQGSQIRGSGVLLLGRLSPIVNSVPSPRSTHLRHHHWPRSPATRETLQGHTTRGTRILHCVSLCLLLLSFTLFWPEKLSHTMSEINWTQC